MLTNFNIKNSRPNDYIFLQEAPYLSICDNTAPTSPASPEAVEVEEMEYCDAPVPLHLLKPSPRALFSPGGLGRSIIPDRENPPQDILDWVSTFSRYSRPAGRVFEGLNLLHV